MFKAKLGTLSKNKKEKSEGIDLYALGRALDTTWGVSSTPLTHTHSVKFTLHGNVLTARYCAIVNFGDREGMFEMKNRYLEESVKQIKVALDMLKSNYKLESGGLSLKTKEISSSDDIEIIGFGVHNPKRTAYFRRITTLELT